MRTSWRPNGRTLYYAEYTSNGRGTDGLPNLEEGGGFSQLPGKDGCISADGSSEDGPGTCGKARAIEGAYQVTLGSKGRDVYVAAEQGNGVVLLRASR